jgi:hypothetical protein
MYYLILKNSDVTVKTTDNIDKIVKKVFRLVCCHLIFVIKAIVGKRRNTTIIESRINNSVGYSMKKPTISLLV